MEENQINQLESFILAPKKEDFLKKLISGTDSSYYFTLLHALNTYGLNLSQECEKALENYKKFNSSRSNGIKARYHLIELNEAKTEKEKASLIKNLNKIYFNLDFSHQKPQHVVTSNLEIVQKKVGNALDESILQIDQYIESAYKKLKHMEKVSKNLFPYLDLKRLAQSKAKIIEFFLERAELGEYPEAPSLLNSYFQNKRKSHKNYWIPEKYLELMTLDQMKALGSLCPAMLKNKNFVAE